MKRRQKKSECIYGVEQTLRQEISKPPQKTLPPDEMKMRRTGLESLNDGEYCETFHKKIYGEEFCASKKNKYHEQQRETAEIISSTKQDSV
jgi:hypothetical protein